MAHRRNNQFVESKVSKRGIDLNIETKNFVCKVEKDMLDEPDDVLVVELNTGLTSSWLGKNIFGMFTLPFFTISLIFSYALLEVQWPIVEKVRICGESVE